MAVIEFKDLDICGKRVLIREDLNVPISNDKVTSDARIIAALPTIEYACAAGAKLMVMSHLGRPEEGKPAISQPGMSLAPVARRIEALSSLKVRLVDDYLGGFEWGSEDLVLFENIRVNEGERRNDPELAKKLAALCDVFVMDAFATAHRAQASTTGVARFAPVACAGFLLTAELAALGKALADPAHPIVAIVGGSKVSTKFKVLDALAGKADSLIVGGAIANTFLAATGINVGKSQFDPNLLKTAAGLLSRVNIPVPTDVVVATDMTDASDAVIKAVADIDETDMVLDIGPETSRTIGKLIADAATIIWNGPVGVFEMPQFAAGTRELALSIAGNEGFSLAGGGDTLAAIDQFGIRDKVSYISTGGGAFLEFVEGKTLPAVAMLEACARK
ncbi:MAG: phosphoglycerate kinase [Proteobacteria bacterium]|nr:phosphoglycerate kinase [Pseudomonadota bacterium]